MFLKDVAHNNRLAGKLALRQEGGPRQEGPDAVLLANVVRARAEALLTADLGLLRVQEVAKELPTRGRLKGLQVLNLAYSTETMKVFDSGGQGKKDGPKQYIFELPVNGR